MPDFAVYPDPVLSKVASPRPVDDDLLATGERLLEAVTAVKAYGLAAAHIGTTDPVVVISVAQDMSARYYRLLFNPRIVESAPETRVAAEGSVSLPGIEVPIERALWVRIAFDDGAGQGDTIRLDGFAARVAQHEIDQMNGLFFLNRLSRLKRDTAMRKFAKSTRR